MKHNSHDDALWVLGSFLDFAVINKLFEGVHGAFVNTDSFTVGAAAEMNAAFNIVRTHHSIGGVNRFLTFLTPIAPPTVGDCSVAPSSPFCLVKLGLLSSSWGTFIMFFT